MASHPADTKIPKRIAINRKTTYVQREHLIKEMLAGRMTRREAAKKANVAYTTIIEWLKVRGLLEQVPHSPIGTPSKVEPSLRARLIKHLLAGEITRTEAALLGGLSTGTIMRWRELRNLSAYQARDKYLRSLFPDLVSGKRSPQEGGKSELPTAQPAKTIPSP